MRTEEEVRDMLEEKKRALRCLAVHEKNSFVSLSIEMEIYSLDWVLNDDKDEEGDDDN